MSIAAVLGAALLLFLEPAPTPAPPKLNLNEFEQGIIDRTNAERAQHGLPALAIDSTLQEQARGQAAWMTNNHTLQHTSAAVGENIAMGQNSVEEAVTAWMNSSGHRANILNPSYQRIGASAYTASDGSVFWCEQFLR